MDNMARWFSTGLATGVLLVIKFQPKNELYLPILQKSTMPSCTVRSVGQKTLSSLSLSEDLWGGAPESLWAVMFYPYTGPGNNGEILSFLKYNRSTIQGLRLSPRIGVCVCTFVCMFVCACVCVRVCVCVCLTFRPCSVWCSLQWSPSPQEWQPCQN